MTPSAAGRLSETPLAHGLVYARNRRLTGRLELTHEGQQAAVVLINGAITTIETRPVGMCPGAFLGAVIYELGHIDTPTLDATLLEIAKTKRRHGEVLLERRAITRAQLEEALIEQVHRKVHHLFTLPETTTYAFYDVKPAESGIAVDPIGPTWRGIRDNPPLKFIAEVVRRLGEDRLQLAPGIPKHLPAAETDLLRLLAAKPMPLVELKTMTQLPAKHVDALVYLLVIARCISGMPSQHAMAGPLPTSMPSGPMRRISSAQMPAVTPSTQMRAVTPSLPIRAVTPSVPIRAVTPSTQMRAITPASPSTQMRAVSASAPPPGTLAALQSPTDLGAEGIAARARSVEDEGLFQVLGVADGASAEAVRAAYLRLSKSWHPDRLAPELAEQQLDVGKIFAHMTRAHQTLCDPDARRAYLRERSAMTTARPRVQLMRLIEQGQQNRDAEGVIRFCQELIDTNGDDAEAHAIQAWASVRWGEASEDDLRAALARIEKAVNIDRTNAGAVYHRGLVHKRLDNVPAAFRDFSRALQLDPKHVDAEREVRIFAMRARKGSGEHKMALRRGR